jgi:hypothetical protein
MDLKAAFFPDEIPGRRLLPRMTMGLVPNLVAGMLLAIALARGRGLI